MDLTITYARKLPAHEDGIAFRAVLNADGKKVATLFDDGWGQVDVKITWIRDQKKVWKELLRRGEELQRKHLPSSTKAEIKQLAPSFAMCVLKNMVYEKVC